MTSSKDEANAYTTPYWRQGSLPRLWLLVRLFRANVFVCHSMKTTFCLSSKISSRGNSTRFVLSLVFLNTGDSLRIDDLAFFSTIKRFGMLRPVKTIGRSPSFSWSFCRVLKPLAESEKWRNILGLCVVRSSGYHSPKILWGLIPTESYSAECRTQ
jgi:hypothetical protein